MNPFVLNRYISPEYFCDRVEETKEILSALKSGRSITLYADRRLGKTSLIHHVLYQINNNDPKVVTAYIDVFDTSNEIEFTSKIVSKVITALEKNDQSIFKVATKYFSQIKPKLGFDPITNLPEFSFEISNEKEVELTLSTLFAYLREKKKRIIIAIDEFQQINEYKDSRLAATLREHIQNTPNVNYIFSGSRRHTLLQMFASPNQPFFNATQLYHLDKIDPTIYKEFIAKHFKSAKTKIGDHIIEHILEWTYTHTSYVQEFCSRLYELDREEITMKDVNVVKVQIFKSYEQVYFNYREMLTFTQWNVLKAIGVEDEVRQPSSKTFLSKYALGAQSSVTRAIEALIKNDMVLVSYDNQDTKVYYAQDVFLRRWMQYKYAK